MPFYRFAFDADVPPKVVSERVRSLIPGDRSTAEQSRLDPAIGGDPVEGFDGNVDQASFRIRRNIGYRNSFVPHVWGRIEPQRLGSRVTITMFMNPIVALFLVAWLGLVGQSAWKAFERVQEGGDWPLIPGFMFAFGIAISIAGFVPEVSTAKRLLQHAVAGSSRPYGAAE